MIISASYRTDIPAFYGEWFKERFYDGFCNVINPYSGKESRVYLDRDSVQAFVFWTKNIGPFFENLYALKKAKIPFMIQYTVNNYPTIIETSTPNYLDSIEFIKKITSEYHRESVVWRYDPIIITQELTQEWHLDNFTKIARILSGYVNEVTVSFVQLYRKTLRNLVFYRESKPQDNNLIFLELSMAEKKIILQKLSRIAKIFGMRLSTCSQPELNIEGVYSSRCIDANRLSRIGGFDIKSRTRGRRDGCLCSESRDIGSYNSCRNGCVYCYGTKLYSSALNFR